MDKQDSENPAENEKELNEEFARVVEAGYEASLGQSDDSSIGFAEELERQTEQNRNASFQYRLLERTRRVWATNILVAANVIVYIVQLTQGIHWIFPEVQPLLDWGANYAPLTFAGEWWRIVTCMFLHGGILHLLLNIYALKMLGNFIERLVGTGSFLALYFVTGIAGSLTSLYWHSSESVGVGASGAICGMFGVLIGYVFWQRHTFPPVFVKAIRNSIVLVIALTVILGYFIENVDQAAHLGGTVLGVLIGIFLSQPFGSFEKRKARLRAIVLVVIGIVGTILAVKTFPEAPVNSIELTTNILKAQKKRIKILKTFDLKYNEAIDDVAGKVIKEPAMLRFLKSDVITPWNKLLERFQSMRKIARDKQRVDAEKTIESMKLRLEAWESLLEALKSDDFPDKKKFDDWNGKWKKAEEFDKLLRNGSSIS